MANPYTPRSTPAVLAGREAELNVVRQRLAPVIASHHAAEGGVILHGVRGIGKTSVLRAAADMAETDGFVVAWTSAAKRSPFLPSLVLALRTALENTDVIPRGGWSLRSLGVEFGAGLVKATATAQRDIDEPVGVWTVGAVERLLRETARLCADRHGTELGTGLVLCVDEFHAMPDDELPLLLNALQNIADDRRYSPPFVFLGAGLPSIRKSATIAATFAERTEFLPVEPLTAEATMSALRGPAEDAGVALDPGALELLTHDAQGYPYFVQLLGFHTWQAAAPEAGDTITVEHARRGIQSSHIDIEQLFISRWQAATPSEREFVVAVARLGGDGPVRRADIADALNKTTQGISVTRERLLNKAVITEMAHGTVQFTVPGFAAFVTREIE